MVLEILKDQRAVRLDGGEIALGARAYDVLVFLQDNAERVVSKEELLEAVWAGVMVEESNLTVQIATLRKALGREAIKTVPGVGYKLTLGAPAPPAPARPALPLPDKPSLTVLPFANLTGSEDKGYLVDGIVNEIATALSRVSSFFVVSTTSSFTYRGQVVDLAEIGRELGVRYILEGSIQQAGEMLRIFTHLLEAETGRSIWQQRFDGAVSDIFDLQDRVAENVAAALEPKVIFAEAKRAQLQPTESLAAYDLCLRATPLLSRQTTLATLEEGLALVRQALALDPDYTTAKALLCFGYTGAFATRWWPMDKARGVLDVAREVLQSGTDDALALAYCGHHVAYIDNAFQEGMIALRQAALINPNSAMTAKLMGWVHLYMDQPEEAIALFERVKRISPLHPMIGLATLGIANALMQMGRMEEAIPYLEQAQAEYPEFYSTQQSMIGAYWATGREAELARVAEAFRLKVPHMSVTVFRETRPYDTGPYGDAIIGGLRATGFPD